MNDDFIVAALVLCFIFGVAIGIATISVGIDSDCHKLGKSYSGKWVLVCQ